MAQKKKYMSDIHLEDYTEEYRDQQITVDSLVFDANRKRESVKGLW